MMRRTLKGSTLMITGSVVAILTLVACKPRSEMPVDESTSPQVRMDTASAMKPMSNMSTMPMNGDMNKMSPMVSMDSMRAHMREMTAMDGEAMMRMLPMHRDMATSMLARMTADRQSMNTPMDANWNATADSVRQDLTGMSAMSASELKVGMSAHQGRMLRLMDWQAGMKR